MEDNNFSAYEAFHAHWESCFRELFHEVPTYLDKMTLRQPMPKEVLESAHKFPEMSQINPRGDAITSDKVAVLAISASSNKSIADN